MPKIVDRDAMQNSILNAAEAVFARDGFHAAKMADVASAAGLAKGTVYLYFASKDALTAALIRRHFGSTEARLAALPLAESRAGFLATLRGVLTGNPDLAAALRLFLAVFAPGFSDPGVRGETAAFFDRIATDLTHRLAAARLAEGAEAQILARSLIAAIDGYILHAALFRSELVSPEAMVETFLDLVAARFPAES